MKAIITTVPFGVIDPEPIELLIAAGIQFAINPLDRKLRPEEVASVIAGFPIVIAGTEEISADVMRQCPELKAICRVGIGLDSVDLLAARERNISVSYTPDGPSPAVAELTVGLMIDLLRNITPTDLAVRKGNWERKVGRRIARCTVGIIGCGRIGGGVIRHLSSGFPGVRILANDVERKPGLDGLVEWVEKDQIFAECDVVSLHIPLTSLTRNMVDVGVLATMKSDAVLINTARGGIVNESDLAAALLNGQLSAAAMDVFEEEPYKGPLTEIPNVVLLAHMGSMTKDCRASMEIEATKEAIRFAGNKPFASPVPEDEYDLAIAMTKPKMR